MPGEVLKLSIQEALITMFTDDPVNWLKWAIVFAILIGMVIALFWKEQGGAKPGITYTSKKIFNNIPLTY